MWFRFLPSGQGMWSIYRYTNGMSKIPSPQKIPTWVTARLSPEAYEQIEKKCKPLDVGTTSTELQAAFILGQQSVLKLLRDEIVISQ